VGIDDTGHEPGENLRRHAAPTDDCHIIVAATLIIPAVLVIFAVLGFNFLGDGVRDAVSPFSR